MHSPYNDQKTADVPVLLKQVQVEVLDYSIEGDKDLLQNHEFTLEVKLSAKSANIFTIRRSYISFCNLDAKLRRIFPKSNLFPLPLPAVSGTGRKKSTTSPGTSYTTTASLTEYVQRILAIPEVLKSTELWNFLDFEYTDGIPSPSAVASVADVVLADVETVSKTVTREYRVPLEAQASEYIAWNFGTKNKDIGFRVMLNGSDIVAYQRYNSHEVVARGIVEVPQGGVVELVWDNSYSKWRSKALSYACRVISKDAVESASSVAVSAIRQSVMYNKTRSSLKRCLLLQAADTKEGRSDSLLQGLSVDEIRFLKLEQQVEELSDQKSILEFDLHECNSLLNDKTVEMQHVSCRLENTTSQRDTLAQELRVMQELCELQRARADDAEAQIAAMSNDIAAVHVVQAENRALTDKVALLEAETAILHQNLRQSKSELDQATKAALRMESVFVEVVKPALEEATRSCVRSEAREGDLRAQLKSVRQVAATAVTLHQEISGKLRNVLTVLEDFHPAIVASSLDNKDSSECNISSNQQLIPQNYFAEDLRNAVTTIDSTIQAVVKTMEHNRLGT